VKAEPLPVEIPAGGSGEAVVRVTIQDGYHVNANPPTYPYLIATELQIKPGEGISAGKVVYPTPRTGTFAFAEKPLAVYEGTTEVTANLTADKTAPSGNRSLNASLRIQACDDQVCYPPGKIDLRIPVTIK
jgi:DsbC/DsbD-like thiol-disulfide interchange protein